MSAFTKKSVTKMYGSMLLALRGGGWGSNFQEKSVGEEGAKSHRGNLSLAQNSIMQMRKSPDNVTSHDPKQ